MIIDGIDFDELPENHEEAFIVFEKQVREKYIEWLPRDRKAQENTDQNSEYYGSYEPERTYINTIKAFIDEYHLNIDISDISDIEGYKYYVEFLKVKKEVEYGAIRFALRKNRIDTGSSGTVITISSAYKTEIGSLLETIRKIINQEVKDVNKRDKIFSKISSLQSEIDREKMTIDAVFGRMIDFSKTVGTCTEELEPLLDKMERLKKIIWDSPEKVDLLPKRNRQKLIPDQSEGSNDDEIPF